MKTNSEMKAKMKIDFHACSFFDDDIVEDYKSMSFLGRILALLRDKTRQFKKNSSENHCNFLADLILNACPELIIDAENKIFVDVGCERGDTTQFWSNRFGFGKVVGIENRIIIKHSQKLLSNLNQFIRGDCKDIPLKSATTDSVFLIGVLEHIKEPEKSLEELRRIMKKNGIGVFMIPNRFFPIEIHTFLPLGGYFPSLSSRISEKGLKTPFYTKPLSRRESMKYLKNSFCVQNIIPVWYPKNLIPKILHPFSIILNFFRIPRLLPFAYIFICTPK
jgi:ubiquinone/menaquinone biosynthesis C-methylase UbiE